MLVHLRHRHDVGPHIMSCLHGARLDSAGDQDDATRRDRETEQTLRWTGGKEPSRSHVRQLQYSSERR